MSSADPPPNSCLIRPFPRLAIVGASTRAAAWSVYFSGRTASTADLFADADLQHLCPATRIKDYPDALADWLERTECDAWLYTGALENHPALVDRLTATRKLMGNSGDTLRRVRDPLLLQETLKSHGLPFPETRPAEQGFRAAGRWLAKTYADSSGSGVSHWSNGAAGYAQRRIDGQPGSALFAGETLLGVSRQLVGESWTGAAEFQYCGSLAPWPLPLSARQQIKQIGKALCRELELQGLFGVDFVCDGEQAWPVEVNPRYPASVEVLELAFPIQAIDWHLSTCTASGLQPLEPPREVDPATVLGKAIWFAEQSVQVTEENTDWALSQLDLADVPVAGTRIEPGQPVLTVRAEAWNSDELIATLQRRLEEVATRFGSSPPLQVAPATGLWTGGARGG